MGAKKRRSAAAAAPQSSAVAAVASARDIRPYIYAGLDVLFAIFYVVIARKAGATDGTFEAASWILAVAVVAAGIGTASRRAWGWWAGIAGCVLLLVAGFVLISLLALSAAFLSGVFGALGEGAASMSLLLAALVVEVYVLLPAFQLTYLLSAQGRREVKRS